MSKAHNFLLVNRVISPCVADGKNDEDVLSLTESPVLLGRFTSQPAAEAALLLFAGKLAEICSVMDLQVISPDGKVVRSLLEPDAPVLQRPKDAYNRGLQ